MLTVREKMKKHLLYKVDKDKKGFQELHDFGDECEIR